MSDRDKTGVLGRRGELLAGLFLQELGPEFVARPTSDLGYDFFVGFNNPGGGVNIAAVEVKATDRPVKSRYLLPKPLFRRLANSNVPVLLLVVNVKENQMFYALPGAHAPADDAGANNVSVPVTAVNETTRNELRHFLTEPQTAAPAMV